MKKSVVLPVVAVLFSAYLFLSNNFETGQEQDNTAGESGTWLPSSHKGIITRPEEKVEKKVVKAVEKPSSKNMNVAGIWECKNVSIKHVYKLELTFNNDKTFKEEWTEKRIQHLRIGTYSVVKKELTLKQEKYTQDGKLKESSKEFTREVELRDDFKLVLKHAPYKTLCIKAR